MSKSLTILALVALLSAIPLSHILPISAGFENHAVELFQLAVLLAGALSAFAFGRKATPAFWFGIAAIWLIMIGREMSWGAVLFAPIEITAEGPQYSSSTLSYRPLVTPILIVVFLGALAGILFGGLVAKLRKAFKARNLPVASLLGAITGFLLAAGGEGNLIEGLVFEHGQLIDELGEFSAYLFLLAAQFKLQESDAPAKSAIEPKTAIRHA